MDWIGGDTSITSSVLNERANKWYKTLHKQKVWNKLSDEQTKILNLTTQLANSKNEIKELKTKLHAHAHVTSKGKSNNGGAVEEATPTPTPIVLPMTIRMRTGRKRRSGAARS
jgi:predicted RNase H-like nuclease (RuvC/YqgF family)